jgi:hypothetical protein
MCEIMSDLLCLHNPVDCSLLIINIRKRTVSSIQLGFIQSQSILVPTLSPQGLLCFYQTRAKDILILDFSKNVKYCLNLPFESKYHLFSPLVILFNSIFRLLVECLFITESQKWILQTPQKTSHYLSKKVHNDS